jgi:hypothetical protein
MDFDFTGESLVKARYLQHQVPTPFSGRHFLVDSVAPAAECCGKEAGCILGGGIS